ncbi:PREDICTED: olfactory receptor 5V1-like [Nanorana parkeri]|uniref:olfactory receptor 5V1-like n=1 Tax=Nanorana parkeri TaxID=125878 RepID=UPI000854A14C|nr:PREDICTED: olfactory receptor 5V1-like [Nanorana parkeri]
MKPEFYIMAFPELEYLWYILFVGVLLFFLMAICGNLLIIVLICLVPHLHTPMYFFLCNLAAQDVIYVSAILPKLMSIILTGDHNISFVGCLTQMYMFILGIETDFFLLTSMAYDRYVAICIPLHYSIIMHFKKCSLMVLTCWVVGALNAALYTLLMSQLAFCHIKAINHFFCDMKAILKLSTGDITHIKRILFFESVVLGCIPFALILISYLHIIFAIQKIKSTTGRLKTFSGCASHIITVILFCGASLSQYINPDTEFKEQDKSLSLLYVAVVPMLNPLVYSLRNKDVLQAMKKLFFCSNVFKE